MRIKGIAVNGLFDQFDHELNFPESERVAIMIAPNGFGKTTILRMVNSIFNKPLQTLARIPFREFRLTFDDRSCIFVQREVRASVAEDERPGFDLQLRYEPHDGSPSTYSPDAKISQSDIGFPIGVIEDIVPRLDQIGRELWRDRSTGETLELDEVIEKFGDKLPMELQPTSKVPEWLQRFRSAIPVRLIDTERLTQALPGRSHSVHSRRYPGPQTERTVRRYSEELGKLVQQTLSEYGALSQTLDRTFPARLVEEPTQSELSMDALRNELGEVEAKRQKLVEAGLLAQDEDAFGAPVPDINLVDESRRGVLAVYARDARQKLSVFDDVLAKVEALKRIANARFLDKQVSLGSSGIVFKAKDGKTLELEMLSSGEQHELVLLYDLLFSRNREPSRM